MKKVLKKINKLPLSTVILIASIVLGGFYYATQISKQKSVERQQQLSIEQERKDALEEMTTAESKKEQSRIALEDCLYEADQSSNKFWMRECKDQGLLSDRCTFIYEEGFDGYRKEKNIAEMNPSSSEELKKQNIDAFFTWEKELKNCVCRLPIVNAEIINKEKLADKDECYKTHPQ